MKWKLVAAQDLPVKFEEPGPLMTNILFFLLGKKIEVITADHQNKPDIASSTARKWFDTEGST